MDPSQANFTLQAINLSWTHAIKMSRFGQMLAAIFVLCLFVNGLIFLLRVNGYSQVVVVSSPNMVPKADAIIPSGRNLQQSSGNLDEVTRKLTVTTQKASTKSSVEIHNKPKESPVLVNPHDYKYLINRPDTCVDSPELIIVVLTSVKNFRERLAVRETWGSYTKDSSHKTKLVFMLGQTDSEDLQTKLNNESGIYKDIIQEDFHDSYRNLSLKSVAMLKWVKNYCSSAQYLLKADDDMYINVPNLLISLKKQKQEKFILGFIFVGARPVQNKQSKWYTPVKDFNEKVYPRYTSGTSYSMSVKAVPELFSACQQIKTFWLEDIYITGLCARKAGIPQFHDGGFSYMKRRPTGCTFRSVVTGHDYKIDELYKIHRELYSDPPLKC